MTYVSTKQVNYINQLDQQLTNVKQQKKKLT